ncbi:glycosyltransferase [Alphaproteobacteria bacterium]|nr:glycosyltransferase [Alphaproteobacteria bacterium]
MKISIITVTYNCASVVEKCLASIAEQSYTDVEHIVVDGASRDGTLDILNIHRSHFAVLLSEPDTGIYDAMNKGLALASGDIVGFLNADDFYAHDRTLESIVQCFTDDDLLDACYSDLIYVDKSDISQIVRYWQSNSFVASSFSRGWCPPHPTFFVRRSVYERFGGFDLTYRIAADIELMMRFLEVKKINVKYTPEVWVTMRTGGASNKNWLNICVQNQEVLRALKRHGLSANPLHFFISKIWSRGLQFLRRPTV